jgi:ABC-2 type transport system permease protein
VRALLAIVRRELLALWVTPLGWVLLVTFLLLQGGAFASIVTALSTSTEASLDLGITQALYGQSVFVPLSFLLLCPALTMRSFAEERQRGTLDVLLGSPVPSCILVIGKYSAALLSFLLLWSPTLLFPVLLRDTGQIEWSVVASSYLGIVALGAGFLSLGLLCSALAGSQLVALALSITTIFGLVLFGVGEQILEPGSVNAVFSHVSIQSQLAETSQGIITLGRLTFDATLVVLPLLLCTHLVDSWRSG